MRRGQVKRIHKSQQVKGVPVVKIQREIAWFGGRLAIAAQRRGNYAVICAQPVDDLPQVKAGGAQHPMYRDNQRAAARIFIMQARAGVRFDKRHHLLYRRRDFAAGCRLVRLALQHIAQRHPQHHQAQRAPDGIIEDADPMKQEAKRQRQGRVEADGIA